jgi:streptogramin lyase
MKRIYTFVVVACLSAAAMTIAAVMPAAQSAATQSVWGTVRDGAGKPVDGALVSIRSVNQTFTTSVFTDEKGEYVTPPLASGRYRMWAEATGFGTERADLTLGKPSSQSFTLRALDDFGPQLTGTEWFDALPETAAEDKRAKQALRVICSDCHSLAVVLQNRFDENSWKMLIQDMADTAHNGWKGRDSLKQVGPFSVFKQTVLYHKDMIAAYLAKVRGPNSPQLKLTPRPRPRGEAARVVITDYDLPIGERPNELAWFDGSDWEEGPAVGTHGIVGPHDVIADRAGNVWVFESRTSFETHRTLVKLDPQTGKMTSIAAVQNNRILSTEQIVLDQSDHVWSGMSGSGGMRWQPNGDVEMYPAPKGYPPFVNSLDVDSAGRIWFNCFFGSARFDPKTKEWKLWKQPTPYDGFSYGMAADSEDNGWWSLWNGDIVAKVDVKTDKIVEIPMHDPEYDARKALATPEDLKYYDSIGSLKPTNNGGLSAHPIPYQAAPRRMAADKLGTTIWVPNWGAQNIAEIDIHTLKPVFHFLPVHGQPYKVDVDNHHNVYASVPMADSLVKYTPSTKSWTVYPFATHGCGPRHMSVDKFRDEVWVPCDQASKVQRFQFRTPQQIQSQKAAARSGR